MKRRLLSSLFTLLFGVSLCFGTTPVSAHSFSEEELVQLQEMENTEGGSPPVEEEITPHTSSNALSEEESTLKYAVDYESLQMEINESLLLSEASDSGQMLDDDGYFFISIDDSKTGKDSKVKVNVKFDALDGSGVKENAHTSQMNILNITVDDTDSGDDDTDNGCIDYHNIKVEKVTNSEYRSLPGVDKTLDYTKTLHGSTRSVAKALGFSGTSSIIDGHVCDADPVRPDVEDTCKTKSASSKAEDGGTVYKEEAHTVFVVKVTYDRPNYRTLGGEAKDNFPDTRFNTEYYAWDNSLSSSLNKAPIEACRDTFYMQVNLTQTGAYLSTGQSEPYHANYQLTLTPTADIVYHSNDGTAKSGYSLKNPNKTIYQGGKLVSTTFKSTTTKINLRDADKMVTRSGYRLVPGEEWIIGGTNTTRYKTITHSETISLDNLKTALTEATKADGDGTIHLYANWEGIETAKLTLKRETGISKVGKSGDVNHTSKTYDITVGTEVTIDASCATGYEWGNWTGDAEHTNAIQANSNGVISTKKFKFTMPNKDITLVARPARSSYEVRLHANIPEGVASFNWNVGNTWTLQGGTKNETGGGVVYPNLDPATQSYEFKTYQMADDNAYTLPQSHRIEFPGYHIFKGNDKTTSGYWTEPDGGDYIDAGEGNEVNPVTMYNKYVAKSDDGILHLYAQWLENFHLVQYHANGGLANTGRSISLNDAGLACKNDEVVNKEIAYTTETIDLNNVTNLFTRDGYYVDGGEAWRIGTAESASTITQTTTPVTLLTNSLPSLDTNSGSTLTLYANWKPTAKIVFLAGGTPAAGYTVSGDVVYADGSIYAIADLRPDTATVTLPSVTSMLTKPAYKVDDADAWVVKSYQLGSGTPVSYTGSPTLPHNIEVSTSIFSLASLLQTGGELVTIYLEPNWKPDVITVNYDYGTHGGYQVGTGATKTTQEVTIGQPIPLPTDAQKAGDTGVYSADNPDGWQFIGWTATPNSTTLYPQTNASVDLQGLTLYACYQKTVTTDFVSYAYGGAEPYATLNNTNRRVESPQVTIYNTATTGTITTPTPNTISGWTARGWTKDTDTITRYTTGNYQKGATFYAPNTAYTVSQNSTLYAEYARDILWYYVQLGTVSQHSQTIYRNSYNINAYTKTAAHTTPIQAAKTGWTPNGWSKNADCQAAPEVKSGSAVTVSDGDVFYGLYTKAITISYDPNSYKPQKPMPSSQTTTGWFTTAGYDSTITGTYPNGERVNTTASQSLNQWFAANTRAKDTRKHTDRGYYYQPVQAADLVNVYRKINQRETDMLPTHWSTTQEGASSDTKTSPDWVDTFNVRQNCYEKNTYEFRESTILYQQYTEAVLTENQQLHTSVSLLITDSADISKFFETSLLSDLGRVYKVVDRSVARVTQRGVITGIAAGTTKVNVFASDGKSQIGSCDVVVSSASVTLPKRMVLGESATVKLRVHANAPNTVVASLYMETLTNLLGKNYRNTYKLNAYKEIDSETLEHLPPGSKALEVTSTNGTAEGSFKLRVEPEVNFETITEDTYYATIVWDLKLKEMK